MEDLIQCDTLMFEDTQLDNLVVNLNLIIKARQNNFADLCCCVAKIYYYCKENNYKAKDNEYYNATKLLGKFGFDRKAISRIVKCYEKFVTGSIECSAGGTNLKSDFFLFSPSKLFELLVVSNSQLYSDLDKGILSPSMTKKEIRNYVKSLRGGEIEENKVLEEPDVEDEEQFEEEFFSVHKHYDLEFFESCSKEQLLSIVLIYQCEYEKLKNKGGK